MAWRQDKTWELDAAPVPEYVTELHSILDQLPLEDMIAGGPAVGTDDLVLSLTHAPGRGPGFEIQVGPRSEFMAVFAARVNPTWGRCHPSDMSFGDPPGSKAIWVAFISADGDPAYVTRSVVVAGAPGGDA